MEIRRVYSPYVLLAAFLPFSNLSAQTAANPGSQPSASYLLIVETSRAMQPRARAVYDSVKEIIDSNFKGQLREDDKFGIWTFSDTLDTGYMPFAAWSPETHLTSAMRAGRFSQTDTYVNRPNLEKLAPELNRLLLQPGSVTVLLYTTGKNEIHGTALDDQINASYKQWQDQQQKANMPLVTLLCAQDGKITHWSVTPAPWPFEIPARTLPSQLAQAQAAALQIAQSIPDKPSPPPTPTSNTAPEPKADVKETPSVQAQAPTPTPATEPELKLSAPPPEPVIASTNETQVKSAPPTSGQESAKSSSATNELKTTSAPAPAIPQENPAPDSVDSARKDTAPSSFFVYRRKHIAAATTNNPVTEQPIAPPESKPAIASPPVAASTAKAETPQPVEPPARDAKPVPETASAPPSITRAANPAPIQTAAATPSRSFLRENLIWIVCLGVVGIATATCFMFWIRSYRRPAIPALTLHDIVERCAAPPMPTPLRRANLPAEKTLTVDEAPAVPDSTTIQE